VSVREPLVGIDIPLLVGTLKETARSSWQQEEQDWAFVERVKTVLAASILLVALLIFREEAGVSRKSGIVTYTKRFVCSIANKEGSASLPIVILTIVC
jgi:hypothetical protein